MFVTVQDLLDSLYAKGKRKDIVSIDKNESVKNAAILMADEGINLLAVTYKNRYVGVVSTSDTSKDSGSSIRPSERMVSEIMKENVITVLTDDSLMDIPKKFQKIRHVVVVDKEGGWVAILDSNEVLGGVMQNISEEEHFEMLLKHEFRRTD